MQTTEDSQPQIHARCAWCRTSYGSVAELIDHGDHQHGARIEPDSALRSTSLHGACRRFVPCLSTECRQAVVELVAPGLGGEEHVVGGGPSGHRGR